MPPPVRIFTYDHFEGLWVGAIHPWMEAARRQALMDSAPWVVLAPDVVRRDYLKQKLAYSGSSAVLGVRFLTPGQLRTLLLEQGSTADAGKLATGEDLQAVARAVAAQSAAEDRRLLPLLKDASGFTRAWDGWTAARASPDCWAEGWNLFRQSFEAVLSETGLCSTAQADWKLLACQENPQPLLGGLFIWGFTYDQAALYPLLLAAAKHAREATLAFPQLRESLKESVWLGSFEQAFGRSAEMLTSGDNQTTTTLHSWALAAEFGESVENAGDQTEFRLFGDRESEAAFLVHWAENQLRQIPNARIGIVLPREPTLAREVVRLAQARMLPVHDAIGHFPVAPLQQRLFGAWVSYQKTALIGEAQKLLELLPYLEGGDERETCIREANTIIREWQNAGQDCFSTDATLIRAYLHATSPANRFFEQWPLLPVSAEPRALLEQAEPVLKKLGFMNSLEALSATWKNWKGAVSRSIWIDWLYGSLRIPGKQRAPQARNSFAPIQIIHYHQVGSQHWTHLAFGGMNEGLVPEIFAESPYWVPDTPGTHLLRSRKMGIFGEGHETLQPDKGFLPGEQEQRNATWRGILDAISATSHSVLCSAVWNEDATDRQASVLSQPFLQLLQAASARNPIRLESLLSRVRIESLDKVPPQAGWNSVEQTLTAIRKRHDPSYPFDGYSFCRESSLDFNSSLAARQWEAFLSRPASVWLEACCHLRPHENLEDGFKLKLIRGNQVHRLLAGKVPSRKLGSIEDWRQEIDQFAGSWLKRVQSAHEKAGQSVPRWWLQIRGLICQDAMALLDGMKGLSLTADTQVHSEWNLPSDTSIWLSEEWQMGVRGKVDCLLEIPSREPVIVDFKTGKDKPISEKALQKGQGLQVLIYGLACAGLRSDSIGLCILTPRDALGSVQLSVVSGQDPSGLLIPLCQSVNQGLFGESETIRSEHAFVGSYPLTTMALPRHVWLEKWNRTHPLLQVEVES